ncbi:MAG: SPOR domain-containing protein, partial [Spirochaetes bacterium]|nr:SPOR domain-containing protein [Spirochaetota bacterium]
DYYKKLIDNFPHSFEAHMAVVKMKVLKIKLVVKKKIKAYEIQLSAFRTKLSAEKAVNIYRKKGLSTYIYKYRIKKKNMYSVRMGYFKTRYSAKRGLKRIKKLGISGFIRFRHAMIEESDFVR